MLVYHGYIISHQEKQSLSIWTVLISGNWQRLALKGSWFCWSSTGALLPPRGGGHKCRHLGSSGSANDSFTALYQPDLIATSVGLHGRVIPGAEVEVRLVRDCALQGRAQLGSLGSVVGCLGIAAKLPGDTEQAAG